MQNNRYYYKKATYLLSETAYTNLATLARQANYIQGQQTNKGLSNYINSHTLIPAFTEDDLKIIRIAQKAKQHHDVYLNGEYRWGYKLALADVTKQHLSELGLKYMLWQRQPTNTAMISGALEAWGNHKFTPNPRAFTLSSSRATFNGEVNTFEVTRNQLFWLQRQAQFCEYEEFHGYFKGNRGFNAFIHDFRLVPFEPFPYNIDDPNPHPNVPPLPDDDVITVKWRTTSNFQGFLDRTLFVPRFPEWPDTRPTKLQYDYSAVENKLALSAKS